MAPKKYATETLDDSFLGMTRKKSPKGQLKSQGRFGKILGALKKINAETAAYAALATTIFSIVFISKVPLDRFSGKILSMLSNQTRLNWQADSIDFSLIFGPKIIFKNLTITAGPRFPMKEGSLVAQVLNSGIDIDYFSFRPGLFSLMPLPFGLKKSVPAGSFYLEAFGGEAGGSFSLGKKQQIEIDAEDIVIKKILGSKSSLPFKGVIRDIEIDLSTVRARAGTANGLVKIVLDGLQFDAGKFSQAAMFKEIGVLRMGKLSALGSIKNGKLSIDQFSLGGKKEDLDLKLDGDIKFRDQIVRSELDLNLWITPGKKLVPILENPLVKGFVPFKKQGGDTYALKIKGNFMRPVPKAP